MSKTKVYYNSACPVCDAGIRYQQQKLKDCTDDVEWIDVHRSNEAASDVASSLEFVRERLHVVDEEGTIHVGAEAFAELWGKTREQRLLSRSWFGFRVFGRSRGGSTMDSRGCCIGGTARICAGNVRNVRPRPPDPLPLSPARYSIMPSALRRAVTFSSTPGITSCTQRWPTCMLSCIRFGVTSIVFLPTGVS